MPRRKRESASERRARIESHKRAEWRKDVVDRRDRQVKRENKRIDSYNKMYKAEIDAGRRVKRQHLTDFDPGRVERLEAVQFAPYSRLMRYSISEKRRLTKGEHSKGFNVRYIDKLTGGFIDKDTALGLMDSMREERQTVSIMRAKNIGFAEAKDWRNHLLDTKDLGYIIRIYGS